MNKFNLNTTNWGDKTELIADKPMQSDIWAILCLKMTMSGMPNTGKYFRGSSNFTFYRFFSWIVILSQNKSIDVQNDFLRNN